MIDADDLLDAYDDVQADRNIRSRYALAIAGWDDAHNRDRRGCLPEQSARWCQYIAAVQGGFSLERAGFWKWLVENGRMTR